jgi:hypothetical protein
MGAGLGRRAALEPVLKIIRKIAAGIKVQPVDLTVDALTLP